MWKPFDNSWVWAPLPPVTKEGKHLEIGLTTQEVPSIKYTCSTCSGSVCILYWPLQSLLTQGCANVLTWMISTNPPSFDVKPQCWSVDSHGTCRMTPRRLHFVKKKKPKPFCLTANVQIWDEEGGNFIFHPVMCSKSWIVHSATALEGALGG